MNNTIIVCGYPGIGKSTAVQLNHVYNHMIKVIDLDSAVFKERIRDPQSPNHWYVDYVNFAMMVADMHNACCDTPKSSFTTTLFILLSAHKEVREYLNFLDTRDFWYAIPSLSRREEWVMRAKQRADMLKGDERQAAMRAFMRISGSYTSDINAAITENDNNTFPRQKLICINHGFIDDAITSIRGNQL